MAKRLIRWITYNLMFALVPLGASIFLRLSFGNLTKEAMSNSPEILFFSIMVCATSLGDLSYVTNSIGGWDVTLRILGSALLLGAVASSILYGSFLYDSMISTSSTVFRLNLFNTSVFLSIVFFVLSTLVQILIGKIESVK